MGNLRLEMFKDINDQWRLHLLGNNNEVIMSSEAYSSKQACKDTANLLMNTPINTLFIESTEGE